MYCLWALECITYFKVECEKAGILPTKVKQKFVHRIRAQPLPRPFILDDGNTAQILHLGLHKSIPPFRTEVAVDFFRSHGVFNDEWYIDSEKELQKFVTKSGKII